MVTERVKYNQGAGFPPTNKFEGFHPVKFMKDTRIEFRSSPEEKDLLTLAAQLTGVNVSVFLRNAALEAANETIQANETMKLSNRDRNQFLQALDHPPAPTAKLKKAMKKYRQWR